MDSVTHIFLGAAVAQIAVARRTGYGRAFVVGALAATLPDFDMFLYTGNQMRDHALHRHFVHSLIIVPVLAFLALLPFMFFSRQSRPLWKPLYLAAVIACATHTLLDLLTSYGTMIFWPFTDRRYALDIIAIVDPLYTLPLIVGVFIAWRRRSVRPALIAWLISFLYLGIATLQHARAVGAQRELIASRNLTAENIENPRVLPQVGAVVSYRSIYIAADAIHIDAIRVPFFSAPLFKSGGVLPLAKVADLRGQTSVDAPLDFASFADLADGFVARSPVDPLLIADERYGYLPEGLEPVWGIQLEQTDVPLFRMTPRWSFFGRLAKDLFRPTGYGAIQGIGPIK